MSYSGAEGARTPDHRLQRTALRAVAAAERQIADCMDETPWLRVRRWRICGAPVYTHWSVLVAIALLAMTALESPVIAAISIGSYLAILVVHELGHAAVARRLGYEIFAIRIGLVHGRCEFEHPDTEWDAALIAWGGPAAQLAVVVTVFAASALSGDSPAALLGPLVVFLGYCNFVIALLNLAPGAGFDGNLAWRIVPALLGRIRRRAIVRNALRRASKRR